MREGKLSISNVPDAVARHNKITREQLESERGFTRARHVARYLAWRVTGHSFSQIGERTGGVTRTNVVYAFRKVELEMKDDAALAAEVTALKVALLPRERPDA